MDGEPGEPVALLWHSKEFPWFLNLHWQTLIGLCLIELVLAHFFDWRRLGGLRLYVVEDSWLLLQAGWLWKVRPGSTAFYWYSAMFLFRIGGWIYGTHFPGYPSRDVLTIGLLECIAYIGGVFAFRLYMLRYFYETDRLELPMNRWLTFFLNVFYFQYKFNEIAAYRRDNPLRISPAIG